MCFTYTERIVFVGCFTTNGAGKSVIPAMVAEDIFGVDGCGFRIEYGRKSFGERNG